jgi:hypothetical protein
MMVLLKFRKLNDHGFKKIYILYFYQVFLKEEKLFFLLFLVPTVFFRPSIDFRSGVSAIENGQLTFILWAHHFAHLLHPIQCSS